jgi:hypothetical protein
MGTSNGINPNTMINYQLPMTSNIELSVYNQLGHKVATLVSERQHAGQHQVKWNAGHLPSGVYLYQLTANRTLAGVTDQYSQTRKMILIK